MNCTIILNKDRTQCARCLPTWKQTPLPCWCLVATFGFYRLVVCICDSESFLITIVHHYHLSSLITVKVGTIEESDSMLLWKTGHLGIMGTGKTGPEEEWALLGTFRSGVPKGVVGTPSGVPKLFCGVPRWVAWCLFFFSQIIQQPTKCVAYRVSTRHFIKWQFNDFQEHFNTKLSKLSNIKHARKRRTLNSWSKSSQRLAARSLVRS